MDLSHADGVAHFRFMLVQSVDVTFCELFGIAHEIMVFRM